MTADSSNATINHSGDGDGGDSGFNTPSGGTTLSSSWVQIVRGGFKPDSDSHPPCSGSDERNPGLSDPVAVVDEPAPVPMETQPKILDT
ncbi:hypothetical protein R6Q59_012355 [Mikania micrantha]